MKTLRMLTIGLMLAAAASVGTAAEEQNVPTITVMAKRHAPVVERVPPKSIVEATIVMPTDMPEADIDFHVSPVGPALEHAIS